MLCPSRSAWARFATPTKDIGTDPDRFPLLFQSDYTLRHWPRRHLAYWRIISSFVPSQMALCCAQRCRCSTPGGHPPDSGSGRTTSPAGSGLLCLRRISALLCRSSHLPTSVFAADSWILRRTHRIRCIFLSWRRNSAMVWNSR